MFLCEHICLARVMVYKLIQYITVKNYSCRFGIMCQLFMVSIPGCFGSGLCIIFDIPFIDR